ncbi:MAG TPA: hypothetical protein VK034_31585, partial [Enhygromyxa sp.]|nr:hypothetical protein [Enhygromyxa sp.]
MDLTTPAGPRALGQLVQGLAAGGKGLGSVSISGGQKHDQRGRFAVGADEVSDRIGRGEDSLTQRLGLAQTLGDEGRDDQAVLG